MAEEKKITFMWIKVDLQCPSCRKKIKKVLCKFPQIQDQVYNEKENLVAIKVVCCCPEKVKQKIICKGGDTIKSIEIIKETEKKITKPPDQKKPPAEIKQTKPPPKKDPELVSKPPPEPVSKPPPGPVSKPPPGLVCVPVRPFGFGTCCTECYEGRGGGPCLYGHGTRPPLAPKPVPVPFPVPVPAYPVGFGTCCTECYEGRDGGPCYFGHGSPPPCYDGCYCGRPIYDSYGGGYSRSCYTYVSRCEETSPGCTIM